MVDNRYTLMPLESSGKSLAITSNGFAEAANDLGVKAPEIWTVFAVETSGCGFLPDRRPSILYERHIFSRLTKGQFDDGDISDPSPGGYGPGGAHQYDRLARAIALDRNAALQSALVGPRPDHGYELFSVAGFDGVEDMVSTLCDSEDSHLLAFAAFLKSTKLEGALQILDWTSFARGYNGPNFAENQYDAKIARPIPEVLSWSFTGPHHPRRPVVSHFSRIPTRPRGWCRRITQRATH